MQKLIRIQAMQDQTHEIDKYLVDGWSIKLMATNNEFVYFVIEKFEYETREKPNYLDVQTMLLNYDTSNDWPNDWQKYNPDKYVTKPLSL